jgi:pseudaminic acid biosynthesis-associated methylase
LNSAAALQFLDGTLSLTLEPSAGQCKLCCLPAIKEWAWHRQPPASFNAPEHPPSYPQSEVASAQEEQMRTEQMQTWMGTFGRAYTERNTFLNEAAFDQSYADKLGIRRSDLNREFLDALSRDMRILEVGTNLGYELKLLHNMGFSALYGIDIQYEVLRQSRTMWPSFNIVKASAFDLPFRKGCFDLVFTSTVLIHIAPDDIEAVLHEIYRCTSHYIWGYEYFSETCVEVPYRGHDKLLWKTDFARLFLDLFPDLRLVQAKKLPYCSAYEHGNVDMMYLLSKSSKDHCP